jgi:hypothetical protein
MSYVLPLPLMAYGSCRAYGVGYTFAFPDHLPGFACSVAELFE